jgi:hypothetical protein
LDDTRTHDVRIQFADAVYSRGDIPVGVLGMNQSRLFGRWRRQLNSAVMA